MKAKEKRETIKNQANNNDDERKKNEMTSTIEVDQRSENVA